MGAVIKTYGVSDPGPETSYRNLGSDALKQCLEKGGIAALDVLISSGLYPDMHIHEPAFASLIQGELSQSHAAQLSTTFSFDLHNGGGGSLMALRILNGFLCSGKIKTGAIVAGDALPEGSPAGALLLEKGKTEDGFQAFIQETYSQYSNDYFSYTEHTGKELKGIINQDETYLEHLLCCVQKSVKKFLSKLKVSLNAFDLIVSCQSPDGFVSGLADLYGGKRLIQLEENHKCYSAGLILALALAESRGSLQASKRILFINAGPGIMVELATYLNPDTT